MTFEQKSVTFDESVGRENLLSSLRSLLLNNKNPTEEILREILSRAQLINYRDAGDFLDLLSQHFEKSLLFKILVEDFFDLAADLAASKRKTQSVKTIAFINEKLSGGGVERVISLLVELFLKLGKKVIVITEIQTSNEYSLPVDCKRFVVPLSEYRYNEIEDILALNEVDTVVFTDYWREISFKTSVWAKLKNFNVISQEHNCFFCPTFENALWRYDMRLKAYKASTVLTCLNHYDEQLWKDSGVENVFYVPNPSTFSLSVGHSPWDQRKERVALVSRFCNDKGIQFVPKLIRLILNNRPDVKFYLCGWFMSESDKQQFYDEIQKLQVADAIEFIGRTHHINQVMNSSKVMILPSTHEGSPMVILEARSFGLPSVIFDMPYLDNGTNGVVRVPFGDVFSMAQEVIKLLSDQSYWEDISQKARLGLEQWQIDNLMIVWTKLFKQISTGDFLKQESEPVNSEQIMTEFYKAQKYFNENFSLTSLSESETRKIERYNSIVRVIHRICPPNSFRKKVLLYTARKIKKLLN